jgi:CO/xanthine dehydrogenase Mo-binding subunit
MNHTATQQAFLQAAKAALDLDWDTLAVRAGIAPRALKSYRLPATSSGYREMPRLARDAIEDLLSTAQAEPAPSQQAYLLSVMGALKLTRAQLARELGLSPETLRNYMRRDTVDGHRTLPPLVRSATERLLKSRKAARKRRKVG